MFWFGALRISLGFTNDFGCSFVAFIKVFTKIICCLVVVGLAQTKRVHRSR